MITFTLPNGTVITPDPKMLDEEAKKSWCQAPHCQKRNAQRTKSQQKAQADFIARVISGAKQQKTNPSEFKLIRNLNTDNLSAKDTHWTNGHILFGGPIPQALREKYKVGELSQFAVDKVKELCKNAAPATEADYQKYENGSVFIEGVFFNSKLLDCICANLDSRKKTSLSIAKERTFLIISQDNQPMAVLCGIQYGIQAIASFVESGTWKPKKGSTKPFLTQPLW